MNELFDLLMQAQVQILNDNRVIVFIFNFFAVFSLRLLKDNLEALSNFSRNSPYNPFNSSLHPLSKFLNASFLLFRVLGRISMMNFCGINEFNRMLVMKLLVLLVVEEILLFVYTGFVITDGVKWKRFGMHQPPNNSIINR